MIDIMRLVGHKGVLIPVDCHGEHVSVTIIGYCPNKSLMVVMDGNITDLSESALNSNYRLRINHKNVVFHFNTFINRVCHEPMMYFHLHFPDSNVPLRKRRSPRMATSKNAFTLSVNTGNKSMSASLADLSLDGAKLIATERLAKVDEFFCIDMLIENEQSTITLPCKVRYVRTDIQTDGQDSIVFHHGVKFEELTDRAETFISSYLRSAIH